MGDVDETLIVIERVHDGPSISTQYRKILLPSPIQLSVNILDTTTYIDKNIKTVICNSEMNDVIAVYYCFHCRFFTFFPVSSYADFRYWFPVFTECVIVKYHL